MFVCSCVKDSSWLCSCGFDVFMIVLLCSCIECIRAARICRVIVIKLLVSFAVTGAARDCCSFERLLSHHREPLRSRFITSSGGRDQNCTNHRSLSKFNVYQTRFTRIKFFAVRFIVSTLSTFDFLIVDRIWHRLLPSGSFKRIIFSKSSRFPFSLLWTIFQRFVTVFTASTSEFVAFVGTARTSFPLLYRVDFKFIYEVLLWEIPISRNLVQSFV